MKKNLITFLTLILFSIPSLATLYQVNQIHIEAETESAQESRKIAIQNGETDAFWVLIKKIVPSEFWEQIEIPDETVLPTLVQNVSISDEKVSATKYMATLSVRFKEKEMQSFLTDHQIPFLEQDLPPLFIVPIYHKGTDTLIYEENNPVFDYLKNNESSAFVLPTGDLEEIALAQSLYQKKDFSAFSELASNYNAAHILILDIHHQGPYITVQTTTFPPLFPSEITLNLTAFDGQITPQLPDMMTQLSDQLLQHWQQRAQEGFSQPDEFLFEVPIHSMAEWTIIHQRLSKITSLKNVFIRGFKPGKVFLTFDFDGNLDELSQRLAPVHLQLNVQNGALILQLGE